MRRERTVGFVDYNGTGKKDCRVSIEVELQEGKLSICGNIWNPRNTDCYSCGQNLDELVKLIPTAEVKRIHAIWQRWHLNDMKAGTPAQQAELEKHTFPGYPKSHYEWALEMLRMVGPFTVWAYSEVTPEQDTAMWAASLIGKHFNRGTKGLAILAEYANREDADHAAVALPADRAAEVHGLDIDHGYRYGSAWLKEELPAEVVAEVNSWFVPVSADSPILAE